MKYLLWIGWISMGLSAVSLSWYFLLGMQSELRLQKGLGRGLSNSIFDVLANKLRAIVVWLLASVTFLIILWTVDSA